MATSYYWFNPKTSTFYGPSIISHSEVMNLDKDLSEFVDHRIDNHNIKFANTLHDILTDLNWVRLCFNKDNSELSISCNKNKDAFRTIRNFIKKEAPEIKSLFLDIKDIGVQVRVPEGNIDLYIDHGRLELTQNL